MWFFNKKATPIIEKIVPSPPEMQIYLSSVEYRIGHLCDNCSHLEFFPKGIVSEQLCNLCGSIANATVIRVLHYQIENFDNECLNFLKDKDFIVGRSDRTGGRYMTKYFRTDKPIPKKG
jgi:hypothetical protein